MPTPLEYLGPAGVHECHSTLQDGRHPDSRTMAHTNKDPAASFMCQVSLLWQRCGPSKMARTYVQPQRGAKTGPVAGGLLEIMRSAHCPCLWGWRCPQGLAGTGPVPCGRDRTVTDHWALDAALQMMRTKARKGK